MILLTAFSLGTTLSQNTAQLLVFRFLSGAAGACAMSNAPAVIGDVLAPKKRAIGVGIFVVSEDLFPADECTNAHQPRS